MTKQAGQKREWHTDMTDAEILEFNWMEAAARVYLKFTRDTYQNCVQRRYIAFEQRYDNNSFMVRFRRGNHYVTAYVSENRITFKQLRGSKTITFVTMEKIQEYLKTRCSKHHPPLTLDQ